MIRIGNQTAFSAASVREPFDYALAQGFTAFEFFPDRKPNGDGWDDTSLDAATRATIRKEAAAHGVRLSVHARWQANPLRPDSWPLLLRDIDLASDLGATLFNIHLEAEAGIEAYVTAILPVLDTCLKRRLLLAIENTPLNTPAQFNELFNEIDYRRFLPFGGVGMCFDLGHANLCAATRNDYLKFVDQLEAHVPIVHLHLHENWGDHDAHLPLFTGPAAHDDSGVRQLMARLQQRGFVGSAILEQWPEPRTLLDQAASRWQAMWQKSEGRKIMAGKWGQSGVREI